jgi:hypothetical protein
VLAFRAILGRTRQAQDAGFITSRFHPSLSYCISHPDIHPDAHTHSYPQHNLCYPTRPLVSASVITTGFHLSITASRVQNAATGPNFQTPVRIFGKSKTYFLLFLIIPFRTSTILFVSSRLPRFFLSTIIVIQPTRIPSQGWLAIQTGCSDISLHAVTPIGTCPFGFQYCQKKRSYLAICWPALPFGTSFLPGQHSALCLPPTNANCIATTAILFPSRCCV